MTDTLTRANTFVRALYRRAQRTAQTHPLIDLSIIKVIISALPSDGDRGPNP